MAKLGRLIHSNKTVDILGVKYSNNTIILLWNTLVVGAHVIIVLTDYTQ